MRGPGGTRRATLLALALTLALPASAPAVPDCVGQGQPRTLLEGRGSLESVIVDRGTGALFYTDTDLATLMRLDRPGAEPVVHEEEVHAGGGLVPDGRRGLLLGTGDAIRDAVLANVPGLERAGLYRVDPLRPRRKRLVATGLQMANGLARGRDGTVYASADVGLRGLDRVRFTRTGAVVEPRWTGPVSPNGLAVDRAGRFLYAAQTFVPAAIARIDLVTGAVSTFTRPPLTDIAAGLDGMTIDARDRLYVAANAGNAAWLVQPDGKACALARGIVQASAVALGSGRRFAPTSLFAVGFSGTLVEIPNATRARVP